MRRTAVRSRRREMRVRADFSAFVMSNRSLHVLRIVIGSQIGGRAAKTRGRARGVGGRALIDDVSGGASIWRCLPCCDRLERRAQELYRRAIRSYEKRSCCFDLMH